MQPCRCRASMKSRRASFAPWLPSSQLSSAAQHSTQRTAASICGTVAPRRRLDISPVTPSIHARSQPRASSALRTCTAGRQGSSRLGVGDAVQARVRRREALRWLLYYKLTAAALFSSAARSVATGTSAARTTSSLRWQVVEEGRRRWEGERRRRRRRTPSGAWLHRRPAAWLILGVVRMRPDAGGRWAVEKGGPAPTRPGAPKRTWRSAAAFAGGSCVAGEWPRRLPGSA